MIHSWLRKKPRSSPRTFRPVLEGLEKRDLMTAFGVNFGIGNPQGVFGTSVATDATGNIYVTGKVTGTVDFDPGAGSAQLTGGTDGDAFVAKYTVAGSLVWARTFSGGGGENSNTIAVDTIGNVYVERLRATVDFDPGRHTLQPA